MIARLAVVDGEARPNVIDLTPDRPISIGRSRDNSIVLPREEHASRLHARVYYEDGHWLLRDFGMNGTRIDDCRVNQVAELSDGNEIRIGEVRFRFVIQTGSAVSSKPPTGHSSTISDKPTLNGTSRPPITGPRFSADEQGALNQFMQSAIEARDAVELGRVLVQSLFYQTGASLAGMFNLDPTDPLPKVIWPESAAVEEHLARLLTRRVQRDHRVVWLAEDSGGATLPTSSGSYAALYADALALPLRAGSAALGAVHLYKASGYFSDRDRKFAEAVTGFAARVLAGLTARRVLEAEAARLRGTGGDELLGDSPAMVALRSELVRAAGHGRPILLRGETGSGKAAAALEAHRRGPRANGPFVVVRTEAVPAALLEAELFGYRKGAFSGADKDHPGFVAQADGGTLYIDEVTALPADCQARLALLIAQRTYRPLGATHDSRADVKVMAATRGELTGEDFRSDLRTVLGAGEIVVPPLRMHAGDIPHLAQLFLDRIGATWRRDWSLTPDAVRLLRDRSWPGNVRQLKAVLEHAAAEASGDVIDEAALRAVLGEELAGEPA
jgi:two-component system, NtrC family, response regulator HydG